jgi:hypothetical protein
MYPSHWLVGPTVELHGTSDAGRARASRERATMQAQGGEPEVALQAIVPAADVEAVLSRVRSRCIAPPRPLRRWERTYVMSAAQAARLQQQRSNQGGITELRLLADTDRADGGATLMTCGPVIATAHLVNATRALADSSVGPAVQARRCTRVLTSAGAAEFAGSMGFELEHETLRRGHVFRDGAAEVALFELCRRAEAEAAPPHADGGDGIRPADGDDAAWAPLAPGFWCVEVVARGGGAELRQLVEEAEAWADTLSRLVALQPAPAPGTGLRRRS